MRCERERYRSPITSFVWCSFTRTDSGISGMFWTPCVDGPVTFVSLDGLLLKLNEIFDLLDFPQRFMARRRIEPQRQPLENSLKERLHEPSSFKEMIRQSGQMMRPEGVNAFLHVEQRQRASWQGELVLMGQGNTAQFNSAFELMKLLSAAITNSGLREAQDQAAGGFALEMIHGGRAR